MKFTQEKAPYQPVTVVFETEQELLDFQENLLKAARACSDCGMGKTMMSLTTFRANLQTAAKRG